MKKIVLIGNLYHPYIVGGAEVVMQTLAEEFSHRGIAVTVISQSRDSHDSSDEVNGVPVIRLAVENLYNQFVDTPSGWKKPLWHLRDMKNRKMAEKVGRVLDQERPDAVSTHNIAGFSVAVWNQVKTRKIKLVHTLHDYYLLCPRTTMFRDGKSCSQQCTTCALYSLGKRRASAAVDGVIGVSRAVLKPHIDRGYFKAAKAVVIHNARVLNNPVAIRPPIKGPLRIGFIGRIEAAKGIEVALRALSALPSNAWTFRIAGRSPDASYLADLKQRFSAPGIEFLGFIASEEFYPSIDLLIVPSIWNEPLGTVMIEAMGYGVPVIGSRLGGTPELIVEGKTGWLFDPGDVEALSALVTAAINSPSRLEEMRAFCIERRRNYLPEIQAGEYLALLNQLA